MTLPGIGGMLPVLGVQGPAAVVQAAAVGATFSTTLGAAPLAGNYLIAFGYQSGGSGAGPPTVQSGWTSIGTVSYGIGGGGFSYATLAYKLVSAGGGAAQTPFALNGAPTFANAYGMAMQEVADLPPTWAAALQTFSFATPVLSGNVTTTNSATTTTADTLAIGFSGWYGSATTFPIVFNSGWTTRASSDGSGANSQIVATEVFPTSGSGVTLTAHLSPDQPFYGMLSALILLNPA